MIPPYDRVAIGDIEVIRLLDGTFRVDGGAMFGVVPRTLWAKRAVPGGIDSMRLQVETNYWDGEPETLCDGRSLAVRFWEWLTR